MEARGDEGVRRAACKDGCSCPGDWIEDEAFDLCRGREGEAKGGGVSKAPPTTSDAPENTFAGPLRGLSEPLRCVPRGETLVRRAELIEARR